MDFKSYLKENAKAVETELDKILSEFLKETKKISPKLLPLVKEFVDSCEGGKRIRGVLVRLGYELGKGKKTKEIFKIGAALEIMHTAILVHDDIMDQSPTRRGRSALYKSMGEFQAIALGDFGFFLSLHIISQSSFPEKEKSEAIKLFSKVMIDTAIGQILDIRKADPMLVAKLKTAQYTIAGPLCLGAVLAGAEKNLLGLLGEFGDNLGIAFQIKDDILDGEDTSLSLSQAVKYAFKAKRMIPKITQDKKMGKLLESMCEYLVERKS